jgi:hypothetical protein
MEWRNMEGSGRGLSRGSIPQFLWRTEEIYEKLNCLNTLSKALPIEPTRSVSLNNPFFFSMALPTHSVSWPLIQFRNHFSQTVGLLGRVISSSQGLAHRTT